jgi:predicted Zn-dependent peptidase
LTAASEQRVTRLGNGLTVVTERVPGALSLAAGVWVGVGARDEPAELSGVSHFLEHLLFKGTEDRSAQDISRTIDRHGGDINAFTSKEYTAYYCRLPARHAATGVGLLGEVLTAPALRESDVETERQVILEEIAMDDDSPDDVAHRAFGEQLFLDHPLGRDTAGEPDTVKAITADDVRRFFADHYTAGSMVASLAGPMDHDDMLEMVDAAFGDTAPGDARPRRAAPVTQGQSCDIEDDTEQVHIVLGGRALARGDDDREALDVINHVLGGGLSSRLFEEIREKRGLVYSVFSGISAYADAGAYSIYAGAQPRHADEVVGLIQRELRTLIEDGLTDDELDIAKGYLMGAFELGLEDTGARMSRNGGLLCTVGTLRPAAEQVERWDAVDQAATRRVIDRVFADEPIVVRLGPA